MELNDAEIENLMWLLLQGGSAITEDWRRMREQTGTHYGTDLHSRDCIRFNARMDVVTITETGKKAVEATCPKN